MTGRLFTLISQYQEVLPEDRSDFYRFLYNRSKIKPLTYYFQSDSKNPLKSVSFEDKQSPEEKLKFNFDFKQHVSKAKLKEDGLEDKIGKWLEEVENNAETVDNASEKQGTSSTLGTEAQMEMKKRGVAKNYNIDKIEINETLVPVTKTKQTFGELFGDKKMNVSAQKKISALDTFDKLLLEPTIEKNSIEVSMDIDEKVRKQDESITKVVPECNEMCNAK